MLAGIKRCPSWNIRANFLWTMIKLWVPNAPYVEGDTTLPCATYNILLMMCSWFSTIISFYINSCVKCKPDAQMFVSSLELCDLHELLSQRADDYIVA